MHEHKTACVGKKTAIQPAYWVQDKLYCTRHSCMYMCII